MIARFILLYVFLTVCVFPQSIVFAQEQGQVFQQIPAYAVPPVPEEELLEPAERKLTPEEELRQLAEQLAARGPQSIKRPSEHVPALDDLISLFFTRWQYAAIQDARNSLGLVRPLSEQEREQVARQIPNILDESVRAPIAPGIRNISLGGIVYNNKNDWTIWLNRQRVTPNALPEEVLDLKVFDDHVDMKWLDNYTNQIYPIRLRPHQRFNLDSRIFLPG